MQRPKEAPVSSAAPRQLEPIALAAQHRPSTALAPGHGAVAVSVAVPAPVVKHSEDNQQSPKAGWSGTQERRSTKRSSGLVPVASPSQLHGTAGQRYSITMERGMDSRRLSTASSVKSNSRASVSKRRLTKSSVQSMTTSSKGGYDERGALSEDDSDRADSDDNDATVPSAYEMRRARMRMHESLGTTIHEDGGKQYRGTVDNRGITPYVTFATLDTPPSVTNIPLMLSTQPTTCGFCSSTNLAWVLRCTFCGSARMSDAPRLKYLIDMVLSMEPMIKPEQLAKKILDYAKFDRVAMKVEAKLKEAGLVRARAAIMMMNRTILLLRQQMVRMVFGAWKNSNSKDAKHEETMARFIRIGQLQARGRAKRQVFQLWKGYVDRVVDERAQKLSLASKRNEQTRIRHVWGYWAKYMRMCAREKLEHTKQRYEQELNETPHESLKVIERLKENQRESRKLVFAAGDTILELLQLSLQRADRDTHTTLQLKSMYPATAGYFFEQCHGQEILHNLTSGQIASGFDSHPPVDGTDGLSTALEQTRKRLDRMKPSDSMIQWLNFQRRRAFDLAQRIPNPPANTAESSESPASAQDNATGARPAPKPRKEKKKEYKEIKGLQELRASIASPGIMLKLLCHTSREAQVEYDGTREETKSATAASVPPESSGTSTTLSQSAQAQLKVYFKMAQRILNFPPDIISRDAFLLNDFDSLYAYASYLYLFYPNYIAPGTTLSPLYRLNCNYFLPQWEKVKQALVNNEMDPFAQQQFFIFLAKIKRVNHQFLRYEDICKSVSQIGHWHQLAVIRETFNDLSRRVLGKDSNISVALEKETLASWVSLPSNKLLAMCDSEDEFRDIEQVFKENVLDLIKIFRIYGSGAGGKGILEQEFLKVMTKAGVTDKKNILRQNLQVIYQQSRQLNGGGGIIGNEPTTPATANTGGNEPGSTDAEDDFDDRGATPNEFFEALTRVAYHNYQKRRDVTGLTDVSRVAPSGGPSSNTLLWFVTDLVVEKVVPLTKKFQEQGLGFKKQMLHPDVQYVCKTQDKKLKRIFGMYSQRNKNPSSRGKLMDLSDFETLLKDRRLIDALFPHGRIKQLVAFVQQDGEIATTASNLNGYEADCEFVFSEFVEALAAIAVYRNANPYLPFAKKLETFFDENF